MATLAVFWLRQCARKERVILHSLDDSHPLFPERQSALSLPAAFPSAGELHVAESPSSFILFLQDLMSSDGYEYFSTPSSELSAPF